MASNKQVKRLKQALKRASSERRNVGGIKLMPTVAHGAMTPPRNNSIPVHSGRVNLDDYIDIE